VSVVCEEAEIAKNGTEISKMSPKVNWPAFSPASPLLNVFDTEVKPDNAGLADRCAFWAKHPMKGMPKLK
jgi:hypothetical protein